MTATVLPWRVNGWSSALPFRQVPSTAARAGRLSESNGIRDRDHGSWNDLFDQEGPGIYRYALSRLGDAGRAEEVTSEVFEAAWRSAESFQDRGLPARAWLFGIARHVVVDNRRRWTRRAPEISLAAYAEGSPDPGIAAERLDLVRAIANLSPAHAAVITLRFIQGLTLQEAAGALNITPDAVKGRQVRALEALREALQPG